MTEIYLGRHSKADYKEYDKILKSENPQAAFDASKQEGPDLNEAGIKLAKEKAAEFFNGLNPETDRLFIVTSNEARAVGTANIYRLEAKSRGLEIIKPEHTRSGLIDKEGEGEMRSIETLSLNTENMLQNSVFYASEPAVNWHKVDDDFKAKWREARKIIEGDNRGSWGANFSAHSAEIAKIFLTVETAEKFYHTKFKNILRLMKWADKKTRGQEGKKIKILAFGHEDYLGKFLQDEMGQAGIQNCEMINFDVSDDNISATFRGKTKEINSDN